MTSLVNVLTEETEKGNVGSLTTTYYNIQRGGCLKYDKVREQRVDTNCPRRTFMGFYHLPNMVHATYIYM